ncbi:MAG: transposase [Candidatus Omnitrophota bacterium]|nr:transposase [Candidatus Omnitrophota bacterium]
MMDEKVPLVKGEIYHIFSRSIAEFEIFKSDSEYKRMRNLFKYYKLRPLLRFSAFNEVQNKKEFFQKHLVKKESLTEIIAYCIMPTHFHLILKQLKEKGISSVMNNILNSYTRYFNIKTKRKGPLWESRFQRVLVETDEQLLHLTRYIHLNPVTAYLVNKPQDWKFSSYKEYLGKVNDEERICNYSNILEINPQRYKKFVDSHIDYQRELAKIKDLVLDEPTYTYAV